MSQNSRTVVIGVVLGMIVDATTQAQTGNRLPELMVGSAHGRPGQRVVVSVSLQSNGKAIVGTQNDLRFDPRLPIAAKANGKPDCVAVDHRSFVARRSDTGSGGKGPQASFAFLPLKCAATASCTSVRAFYLSLDSSDAFADGPHYTCTIDIARDALPGAYSVACLAPLFSNPSGGAEPATCTSGSVIVFACPGDCDADGATTVDEILTARNIAQESTDLATCRAADVNEDDAVTIDEVLQARNALLGACGR